HSSRLLVGRHAPIKRCSPSDGVIRYTSGPGAFPHGRACNKRATEEGDSLPMVELSAEQLPQRAFDLNLIDERQLQEVLGHFGGRPVSGVELQQLLLRRELLTNYQAERLLRGEKSGFFYGDYKVLYLIGTGTFARVYRASHRTSGDI